MRCSLLCSPLWCGVVCAGAPEARAGEGGREGEEEGEEEGAGGKVSKVSKAQAAAKQ